MNIAIGVYASLLFVGGFIGYLMAHSVPSLVMGIVSASIFAVLSFQKSMLAARLTMGLTALMTGFFAYRFILTSKFFPAGFMSIVSLSLLMWLMRDCFSNACCKSDTNKDLK